MAKWVSRFLGGVTEVRMMEGIRIWAVLGDKVASSWLPAQTSLWVLLAPHPHQHPFPCPNPRTRDTVGHTIVSSQEGGLVYIVLGVQ